MHSIKKKPIVIVIYVIKNDILYYIFKFYSILFLFCFFLILVISTLCKTIQKTHCSYRNLIQNELFFA